MEELELSEILTAFVFRQRPISISPDLRPGLRICIIALLLRNCCRGNECSFAKLHTLSWCAKSKENRQRMLDILSSSTSSSAFVVRIEPSLNRAVDLAIGEGLVTRKTGSKLALTEKGAELADEINSITDLLIEEKLFMSQIGKRVTETLVGKLFK